MKTAFENYIEPARARCETWRLVVGLGCIAIGAVIWVLVVVFEHVAFNVFVGMSREEAFATMKWATRSADPMGVILYCALFVGVWPSVWLVVKFLHRQRFSTLFAPTDNLRLRDFFEGFSLAFAFWLVMTFPVVLIYGLPDRSALALSSWTTTLLPMVVGLLILSGAEELVFRGYILQQLAARWRSPIIWVGMTSILFVVYHGSVSFLFIAWALASGLVLASLVWRTGSLLASIGCHFGVNFFSFIAIGYDTDKFDKSQLFMFQGVDENFGLITQALAMILLLLFIVSPFFPERQRA